MKAVFRLSALGAAFLLSACQPQHAPATATAPGAPGQPSTWSYAGKTGIGTSYEQYQDGHYADSASTGVVSKVWFSLAQGILTETMAGLIHEAQLRELQLVVQGQGFVDEEKTATNSKTDYLLKDAAGRPLALSYRVTNSAKNGQYQIEKQYFTDPAAQSMVVRTTFKALADGLTVYSYIDPALANTGSNDSATFKDGMLQAQDGNSSLTLLTVPAPAQATVGFAGVSDGLTELKTSGKVPTYHSTGEATGNVAALLTHATLKKGETASWDQVIGFGSDAAQSKAQAQQTLQRGLDTVLAHYQGDGDAIG